MNKYPKGISLIEVLISIAIIGGAIAVFATLINVLRLNKTSSLYTNAYKIAQEEIEALRSLPFENLTNRTNDDFINVLYNNGTLTTVADATAPSSPNSIALSATSTEMSLAVLPYSHIDDFTFETSLKASPTTGKVGMLLRATDKNNYYYFYIKNDRLALEKNVNGTTTALYENFQTFTADTWYKLKAVVSGENFSLYLNDSLIQTVINSEFSDGYIAIANENENSNFDSVSVTYGSDTFLWNFDGLSAGEIPADWQRIGINDLPNSAGTLTISEPYSNSDIKQIDVTVSWTERDSNKSITLSTLRSE